MDVGFTASNEDCTCSGTSLTRAVFHADRVAGADDPGDAFGVDEGRGADDVRDFGVYATARCPSSAESSKTTPNEPPLPKELGADMGAARAKMMRGDLGCGRSPCSRAATWRAQMVTEKEMQTRAKTHRQPQSSKASTTTMHNNNNNRAPKILTVLKSPGAPDRDHV